MHDEVTSSLSISVWLAARRLLALKLLAAGEGDPKPEGDAEGEGDGAGVEASNERSAAELTECE